jgi:DNA-binding Lrp family transcriptional regulator
MRAMVLIRLRPQDTQNLMHAFKEIKGVKEANLVHGPYDCVLKLIGENLEAINEIVSQIRALSGIEETMTCLIIQSWVAE